MKKIIVLVSTMVVAMALPAFANSGKPNFMPGLWADGQTWGTKGTTEIPAPNDNNEQSFDGLFVIVNSNNPDGQLPVGEAAPGNINYNAGRWETWTVTWTAQGFADHGTVPVITSYAQLLEHYMLGHLDMVLGPPSVPNPPPAYFQCPLLPVKE